MRRHGGFTYLFMLFTLAILSIATLALGSLQHLARTRAEEAELLRIGGEFRQALSRYRDAHPSHAYPVSLDELLLDERSGVLRRHLRRIYVDPITRTAEWGLVVEQGRIVGVHSLSERAPLKVAGFEPEDREFTDAARYADWVFRAAPLAEPMQRPVPPGR
jgi:type II secretory pathway pseudopilin PulG